MTQDAPVRKTDNGAYFSAFAQDDFRIHPRVTLNLGLRYDLQFPFTDPQDRKLAFVPGQKSTINPTAPVGLLFPGDAGVSRGIVHTDNNNIAPRLGIAWDPMGDGRTAVRAAFGMFYGSITGNEWNTTADNQPFTVRQSFPTVFTLSDPYRNLPGGVGPFPFNYTPGIAALHAAGAGVRSVARLRLAAQLSDQRHGRERARQELQRDRLVRRVVRAQSRRGRRQQLSGVQRRPRRRRTSTRGGRICPARSARRPSCPRFSRSDYNGLQLSAERRGSRLSGKAYYSFGRGYEDVDFQGGGLPGVQNAMNLAAERGRNSNDRTHSLVLSGVFKIDYLRDAPRRVRWLTRDWTVSAIATLPDRHAADDCRRARIATSTASPTIGPISSATRSSITAVRSSR